MIMQTEATIYLAQQRGCAQSDWYRGLYTFNFGTYSNENRKAFGRLQAFNDETLGAGHTIRYRVAEDTFVLLLPLVGGLNHDTGSATPGFLDVGESYGFFAVKDSVFSISNPYENALINFLQIRFTVSYHGGDLVEGRRHTFDIELHKNQLVPFQPQAQGLGSFLLGTFQGREEGTYQLRNPANGVFIFVLEGAFEVQNRLLHARDGLAITHAEVIEFEALSNEAIILIIEQEA
ncbi:pirin [Fulvivirgaceae bacterium PWU4]|uniref:Pirin n=1 Tax=Chryseosolibacter histidini TaxID=2782349 RepID=A0AAP2DKL7_9BACT|nr:pirin [Chryseosolibacter histidini]MBT1698055.1 pirin [Chryseosolibacter histidini]